MSAARSLATLLLSAMLAGCAALGLDFKPGDAPPKPPPQVLLTIDAPAEPK